MFRINANRFLLTPEEYALFGQQNPTPGVEFGRGYNQEYSEKGETNMKTGLVIVANNGDGMESALAQTESAAEQLKLNGIETLHMRLLAEEMLNIMRSVQSQHVGQFWIEGTDKEYVLHLKTVTLLDSRQRAQLLAASTSGKNEAHRGIMGKIRAFFEPVPVEETPVYLAETIVRSPNGDLTWSMNSYRERLIENKDTASAAHEEWNELEKSIVSHLADNVKVSIRNECDVELSIQKKTKQ